MEQICDAQAVAAVDILIKLNAVGCVPLVIGCDESKAEFEKADDRFIWIDF